jgi:hypothetical protein
MLDGMSASVARREKIFRGFLKGLIVVIALSTILHVILLASDSPDYRKWVYVQMGLQVSGIISLVALYRFRWVPLLLFLPLSAVFFYVNAAHTNYGNLSLHLIGVPLFWALFCYLFLKARLRHYDAA